MRALGVFARAPVAGQVKRRLAADVGAAAAVAVYRRVGRQVVEAVTGAGYPTTVWFTPARAERMLRDWLHGAGQLEFRPQSGRGLGARMQHAFTWHFAAGAARSVLIGSDCPGVDGSVIAAAFTALGECDVVIGPALDGGYYLIGLTRPQPRLFAGVAWSTPAVLAQTQACAESLGLVVRCLDVLRDVDTVQDARALGLLKY